MPLGPRRSWGSRWEGHTRVERITKAEVDRIIDSGEYECLSKAQKKNRKFYPCHTKASSLHEVLHMGKTTVKVAGSITPGYLEGYRTIVMTANSIEVIFLLRVPK